MIEFKEFSFRYREGEAPVVRDITLSIPDGCFVGITGAAGSGKSTLTYAINGIIPHCYPGDFYGSVTVEGLDTVETSLTDISRVVGSVCQDIDSQMVSTVVEDEILYGLENFAVPKDEIPARVDEALAAMGIVDLRDRTIDSLSGGQTQKVAVAVFDLLARYAREHGTTVVVVEQKFALLSDYADMLVIVDGGRIRFADTPDAVLAHSDELLALGVNVPRATTLMNALGAQGLYGGPTVRNVAGAAAALKEVLA